MPSSEQKSKEWADAAKRLSRDPSAKVICPSCGNGYLEVEQFSDQEDESGYREWILRCLQCQAWNSLLKGVPSRRRGSYSPENRGPLPIPQREPLVATRQVEVRLTLKSTHRGGRTNPLATGYIGNAFIKGLYTAVGIDLINHSEISPGGSCLAIAKFLNWEYVAEHVAEGTLFELAEGEKIVATAEVLALIPSDESRQP